MIHEAIEHGANALTLGKNHFDEALNTLGLTGRETELGFYGALVGGTFGTYLTTRFLEKIDTRLSRSGCIVVLSHMAGGGYLGVLVAMQGEGYDAMKNINVDPLNTALSINAALCVVTGTLGLMTTLFSRGRQPNHQETQENVDTRSVEERTAAEANGYFTAAPKALALNESGQVGVPAKAPREWRDLEIFDTIGGQYAQAVDSRETVERTEVRNDGSYTRVGDRSSGSTIGGDRKEATTVIVKSPDGRIVREEWENQASHRMEITDDGVRISSNRTEKTRKTRIK